MFLNFYSYRIVLKPTVVGCAKVWKINKMKKWKEHRENLSIYTRIPNTLEIYWICPLYSIVCFFLLVLRNLAFLSISSGFTTQSLTLKIVTYFYNSTSVLASYLKITNCNIITHILMFFKHENKISIGNYTAQNLFRCCPYISTHWTYSWFNISI